MSDVPVEATAPVLVLVAVQDLVNLASCIRVAKNFGITELRLVRPECSLDPYRLEGVAHHAGDVIAAMQVFDDLDAALADLSYVQALTGRERSAKRRVLRPRDAAAELVTRAGAGRVGILAGREDHGLQNEELDRCDVLVTISANPAYTSLNLAQAVLIMAYEWQRAAGTAGTREVFNGLPELAPKEEVFGFFEHLETELDRGGFLKPPEKAPVMVRNLRNLFHRARLTPQDIRTLRGVIVALTGRKFSRAGAEEASSNHEDAGG